MARETEEILTNGSEGYGTVTVTVHDTDTDERHSASVNYCPSYGDESRALADAIEEANNKF